MSKPSTRILVVDSRDSDRPQHFIADLDGWTGVWLRVDGDWDDLSFAIVVPFTHEAWDKLGEERCMEIAREMWEERALEHWNLED